MGAYGNPKGSNYSRNHNNIHNNNNPDEDWIHVASDGEEESHDQYPLTTSGRRRNQRTKKSTKPEPTFAALGVKGKSHKKIRRYANANLLNELDSFVNEATLDEVSINDFMSPTPSSFSLLINERKDSSFNYDQFINCTEEQQKSLLQEAIELEISKIKDKIESNEDCFNRIAPTIRRQLLKKRVPIGILASIEQKVIDHFRNDPQSIYQTILKCSYQRFLLHACCQYLDLYCKSSDTNGKRLSFVHNEKVHFIEPSQLLSEYLDYNH